VASPTLILVLLSVLPCGLCEGAPSGATVTQGRLLGPAASWPNSSLHHRPWDLAPCDQKSAPSRSSTGDLGLGEVLGKSREWWEMIEGVGASTAKDQGPGERLGDRCISQRSEGAAVFIPVLQVMRCRNWKMEIDEAGGDRMGESSVCCTLVQHA
jgi:hypothetical protein